MNIKKKQSRTQSPCTWNDIIQHRYRKVSFYKIVPHSSVPGSHLSSDIQNNGHGNVCPWEKHAGCWPIPSRPISPHQAEITNGTSTGDDSQATVQCIKPSICLHWLRRGTSPRYRVLGEQASYTCSPGSWLGRNSWSGVILGSGCHETSRCVVQPPFTVTARQQNQFS